MKTKKKKKQNELKYVTLENVIYTLRISEEQMDEWIQLGVIRVYRQNNILVMEEKEFKNLAHSSIALNGALYAFAHETDRRHTDTLQGKDHHFRKSILSRIIFLKKYIQELESIHRKHHNDLNVLANQTGVEAAYIIFSKIFSLINMAFLCMENQYWESTILIRPIIEALDLATYFLIEKNSAVGKQHLLEWFRENKIPSNVICRKAIGDYRNSFLPVDYHTILQNSMNELYHSTSKPIHIGHNNIMEVYITKRLNGFLLGVGFDYGPCSYPRKIDGVATYFQSLTLSVVQTFIICFQVLYPLVDRDDIFILESLQSSLTKAEELDMDDI